MTQIGTWFKGLRGKLLLLALLPILAIGVLAYIAVSSVNKLSSSVHDAYATVMPTVKGLSEMDSALNGMGRWTWATYMAGTDLELSKKGIDRTKRHLEGLRSGRKLYESAPSDEKEKAIYKGVSDNLPALEAALADIITAFEKHTPAGNEEARELIIKKYRPTTAPIEKAMDEIQNQYVQIAAHSKEDAENTGKQALAATQLAAAITSLALFVLMLTVASKLATTLSKIGQQIAQAGSQVGSASTQLSSASQQVSSGSTEAASSLEETVSSVEELSSIVKLNADNARQAAALSQNSSKSAEEGEMEIKSLIQSMTDISQSSKKIEEIINVIDDIAFQTNLLALNAAVEAARAGQQGKGFAVVAEAVRNLAQRSASAAKEITTLIKDSVTKIERGTKTADTSGSVLKNIVTSIKKVSDLNAEISSASSEQANGISQISKAMAELDTSTQQNASASEEVAASAEEMSGQSEVLHSLVMELVAIVDGSGSDTAQPRSSHPAARSAAPRPRHGKPVLVTRGGRHGTGAAHAESVIPMGDFAKHDKVGTTDGF